jgi:saccharopine dehydrogenase-like NADP-dependent oxidoreductase
MKTIVVGVGAVGSVTADLLAHSDEFDEVILADLDLERAKRVEKKISSDKVEVKKLDASDVDGMARVFKGIDLVLNAVIPRFNYGIMDACLKAGSSYADMACDIAKDTTPIGGIVKETPLMWQISKYDEQFRKKGLSGMLGLGCEPGLANIFARVGADRLDRVKDICVRDGDNSVVEGYDFAPMWSPETLIEEVLMPATIYKDGHYRKMGSLQGKEMLQFPDPVGKLNIYNVDHEEQETLPTYIGQVLGKGCDYCDFKIAFDDATVEAIRTVGRLGLSNPNKIKVKGVEVAPRDVVAAVLPDPATIGHLAKGDFTGGTMVTGAKNGRDQGWFFYTHMNHQECYRKHGHSATAYTVGAPLAIGAILFAQGKIKMKGVFPPEMLDPEPFVKMLPRFGMTYLEKKL